MLMLSYAIAVGGAFTANASGSSAICIRYPTCQQHTVAGTEHFLERKREKDNRTPSAGCRRCRRGGRARRRRRARLAARSPCNPRHRRPGRPLAPRAAPSQVTAPACGTSTSRSTRRQSRTCRLRGNARVCIRMSVCMCMCLYQRRSVGGLGNSFPPILPKKFYQIHNCWTVRKNSIDT